MAVEVGFDFGDGVEALGDEVESGIFTLNSFSRPVTRSGRVKESRVPESKRLSSGLGSLGMSATAWMTLRIPAWVLMVYLLCAFVTVRVAFDARVFISSRPRRG